MVSGAPFSGQWHIIYFHIAPGDISYATDVWLQFHQSEQRNGILYEDYENIVANISICWCFLSKLVYEIEYTLPPK